jgi:hypothetical protein
MATDLAALLQQTIDTELIHLRRLTDEQAAQRPENRGWSPKQELGHLIDSSVNNHVRFVLGATQPAMQGPTYAQDAWVDLLGYAEMPWDGIIDQWYQRNRLLVWLIGRIPGGKLQTLCTVGCSAPVTLRFLIEDYILHMQHHIDQLLCREFITEYPGKAVGV